MNRGCCGSFLGLAGRALWACGPILVVAAWIGCDGSPIRRASIDASNLGSWSAGDPALSDGDAGPGGSIPEGSPPTSDAGRVAGDAVNSGDDASAGSESDGSSSADAADPMAACRGISCGGEGKGRCEVDASGEARCNCDYGYVPRGLQCVGACEDVECEEGKACVPGHHGVTDPLCVPTCDCSNCGNCDAEHFDGVIQRFCGNSEGSPANTVCNRPCPAGQGCIPFRVPICWSLQGCFSM
jgi:hypothetical protein